MGFVKRIRDITLATLNEKLENTEDPVRLIDQFLWSTRDEIVQLEKLHHQYYHHVQQLRGQWLQYTEQVDKKEHQALIALKAGEESIARQLLLEKSTLMEQLTSYRELYEQANQSLVDLEEQLTTLKQEYQIVYDKRQYYAARMETIRLQRRMNERLGFKGQENTAKMMSRMDNRLNEYELENEALRQVRSQNSQYNQSNNYYSASKNLEVEQQLEQLKKRLNKEG